MNDEKMIEGSIAQTAIEAVAGGYCADPFAILGPHKVPSRDAWTVRVFLPQAETAEVLLENGHVVPMERLHKEGVFLATMHGDPAPYRLHFRDWQGGTAVVEDPYRFGTVITSFDLHLHSEGKLLESWNTMGAHCMTIDGVTGVRFAVWAPNAETVSVAGDFNSWDTRRHPMRMRDAGIWEIFLPGAKAGDSYKYLIRSRHQGYQQLKADPFGFASEKPPKSASIVCDIDRYQWNDAAWMESRGHTNWLKAPISVYEVHLESWRRGPDGQPLTYMELAEQLVRYVTGMGYTHIELMPIQEHPFSGSWGYQVTGYFAPTSRFGDPADFMCFVDACHKAGIGVIMDWVPAHFPKDAHGLAFFDGTALYEHADPRQGEHHDWGTKIFNFGRNEVREFLVANALFWLKKYHIDGLRVDAVASMLYLDYSRKEGEWMPNKYGGRENLEAIEFLRRFNEQAHTVPGAFTIAEESTAFPGVSRPVYTGGLGFTMKWNMGWMHDMLHYFGEDPVHRKYHHNNITFSMLYAFTENFLLPISHDEVVYGKKSLIGKMPGDQWRKFANARAFLGYMFAHPGKKLLFMGCDIGTYDEWDSNASVPWEILSYPIHDALRAYVRELNLLYRTSPALYQIDADHTGFEWIDFSDVDQSTISFLRRAEDRSDCIVFACNFTPVPRPRYSIGVPEAGYYREVLNSDSEIFGGSNCGNAGGVMSTNEPRHGRPCTITVTLPPLAILAFRIDRP